VNDAVVDVFSIVGGIANVAMAVAAVWAFVAWRRQITGASDHELAKKVSAALWQVALLRGETLEHLGWLHELNEAEDGDPTPSYEARVRNVLLDSKRLLHKAVDELQALHGQVAVQWGDAMLDLIEVIRFESFKLVTAVEIELVGDGLEEQYGDEEAEVRRLAFSTPDRVAPTFTGRTFAKAMGLYTALAQEWLAVHLGRKGARAMDEQELAAKRKLLDREVQQLAESERLALKRKRAGEAVAGTTA
jgi:hypothetical protein